jgi:hypothetical protein
MARNTSRDYALMTDEERRRFAAEQQTEEPAPMDFEDPRKTENQGHSQIDQQQEEADEEHRDGPAAQLNEDAHDEAVDD